MVQYSIPRAENVFYRFEDARYSVADEYGDHAYTSYKCRLLILPVIKYTPKGAWIGLNYAHYPRLPSEWTEDSIGGKRFVNLHANKRFALPTVKEARESYHARKQREISIYKARIEGAELHIEAMEHFVTPEGWL